MTISCRKKHPDLLNLKWFFILLLVLFVVFSPLISVAKEYHIAMIGPLTGSSPMNGKHHQQGIMLLLDKINAEGGINGNQIVLDVHDDQNNKTMCREKALEVATKTQALAVIGHNYSSCSISAGPVYKEHGLAAISPSSSDPEVTMDNDWFFRTIYNNNLQGRFLANYVKSIFNAKKVAIVHEDLAYGAYLADIFENTSNQLGVKVIEKLEIKTKQQDQEKAIEKIIQRIKAIKDLDVIFLATHAPEGIKFVKQFKDLGLRIPIIAPSTFASGAFANGFKDFPKEKLISGFYNNGIFVASPIIFDDANQKAQRFNDEYIQTYHDKTDWRAAFAYDAAQVLVEAIKATGVSGEPENLKQERKAIRDYLAGLNGIEKSVEGVTGFNYFNQSGDPQKPISIGVLHNRNIISSLTQLRPVRSLGEIANLEKALQSNRVLQIEGQYMYQTQVVYTGIEINEISDLDVDNLSCTMDFNLWFRYQGGFDVSNITFLNADEPIKLANPIKEYQHERINYRLYHVKAKFKLDAFNGIRPYGKHSLGVRFLHNDMTKNNLIFVKDVVGLGNNDGASMLNAEKKSELLNPVYGWSIQSMTFYQADSYKSIKGEPKYLNAPDGLLTYSTFNVEVLIGENKATVRGIIPGGTSIYVSATCLFVFLILIIGTRISHIRITGKPALFVQSLLWLLFLLSFETVLAGLMIGKIDTYKIEMMTVVFDALWWIIPGWLIVQAVEILVWQPLEHKTGQIIPTVIRHMTAFLIMVLVCFGVIAFVFDQKLTSLLATSGVLAMIIGLAIQMNISDIVSGIVVNLERPFRIGDWVKIGSTLGRVENITWRSTKIATAFGNIVAIPNSTAAGATITNFNFPNDEYYHGFTVNIPTEHNPDEIEKLLVKAVSQVKDIIEPWVMLAGISDWSSEYWVYFRIKDYGARNEFLQAVWKSVWKTLKAAGIKPAIRRHAIHIEGETEPFQPLPPA